MAEYIEREAHCKKCIKYDICEWHENIISPAFVSFFPNNEDCQFFKSAADVVEVRHGEWNIRSEIHQMLDDVDEELFVECPFCQRRYYVPFEFEDEKILEYAREEYPYCHCGAKMDGKENTK